MDGRHRDLSSGEVEVRAEAQGRLGGGPPFFPRYKYKMDVAVDVDVGVGVGVDVDIDVFLPSRMGYWV